MVIVTSCHVLKRVYGGVDALTGALFFPDLVLAGWSLMTSPVMFISGGREGTRESLNEETVQRGGPKI